MDSIEAHGSIVADGSGVGNPGGSAVGEGGWWWMTPMVFGAFGGLAPQILETLQDAAALGLPWWEIPGVIGRVGALPIYAAVGSVVAVSLRESDMWKAIVLGTSAPAMILNAAHGSTTVGLMVLHAQDDPPAAQVAVVEETRSLTIEQDRVMFDKTVVIHSEQPARELRETESGTWRVPASAFSMSLEGSVALGRVIVPVETPAIQVPAGSRPIVIRLTMDPEQTAWGGFLDGLGFDRLARERYTELNPRLEVNTVNDPQ